MAPTAKKDAEKAPALKGKEAEDRILQYMKECNRPYGAADVSANIKNVVSKPATQKILAALAEKGAITVKTYGKTSYYVANQSECEDLSVIQLTALETQINILDDEVKGLTSQQKQLNSELGRVRATPRDAQLDSEILAMQNEIAELEEALSPLRAGSALLSEAEVQALDQDWNRWRNEWVARKRVFATAWGTATDGLNPGGTEELAEELGIDPESSEHQELEKSELCQMKPRRR